MVQKLKVHYWKKDLPYGVLTAKEMEIEVTENDNVKELLHKLFNPYVDGNCYHFWSNENPTWDEVVTSNVSYEVDKQIREMLELREENRKYVNSFKYRFYKLDMYVYSWFQKIKRMFKGMIA